MVSIGGGRDDLHHCHVASSPCIVNPAARRMRKQFDPREMQLLIDRRNELVAQAAAAFAEALSSGTLDTTAEGFTQGDDGSPPGPWPPSQDTQEGDVQPAVGLNPLRMTMALHDLTVLLCNAQPHAATLASTHRRQRQQRAAPQYASTLTCLSADGSWSPWMRKRGSLPTRSYPRRSLPMGSQVLVGG